MLTMALCGSRPSHEGQHWVGQRRTSSSVQDETLTSAVSSASCPPTAGHYFTSKPHAIEVLLLLASCRPSWWAAEATYGPIHCSTSGNLGGSKGSWDGICWINHAVSRSSRAKGPGRDEVLKYLIPLARLTVKEGSPKSWNPDRNNS